MDSFMIFYIDEYKTGFVVRLKGQPFRSCGIFATLDDAKKRVDTLMEFSKGSF